MVSHCLGSAHYSLDELMNIKADVLIQKKEIGSADSDESTETGNEERNIDQEISRWLDIIRFLLSKGLDRTAALCNCRI